MPKLCFCLNIFFLFSSYNETIRRALYNKQLTYLLIYNMNGNENPDATPAEDVLTKEEEKEEYYEEGNGGATD
jgi:hypothetical protein